MLISEPDLNAAIEHLRGFPNTQASTMPTAWAKSHVLELIRNALPKKVKAGDTFKVGPGLWVAIQYVGVDLVGVDDKDKRLQACVLVRPAHTDMNALIDVRP